MRGSRAHRVCLQLHRRAEPRDQGRAALWRPRDCDPAGAQFGAAAVKRARRAGTDFTFDRAAAPGRLRLARRYSRRHSQKHAADRRDPRQQRHRRDSARGGNRPDVAARGRLLSDRRRAGARGAAGKCARARVRPVCVSGPQIAARPDGHGRAVHSPGAFAAPAARGRHRHRFRKRAAAGEPAREIRIGHAESARNRGARRGLRFCEGARFGDHGARARADAGRLRGAVRNSGRGNLFAARGGRARRHRELQPRGDDLVRRLRPPRERRNRRARRAALRAGRASIFKHAAARRGARERRLCEHV